MYYSYSCAHVAQYLDRTTSANFIIFLAWRTKIYTDFLAVKYVADVLRRFQPGSQTVETFI